MITAKMKVEVSVILFHVALNCSYLCTQTVIVRVHNLAMETDPVREPTLDGSFMFHTIKRRFRVSSSMRL